MTNSAESSRYSLQFRLVLLLAATLFLVFGIVGAVVVHWTMTTTDKQLKQSASTLANTVTDAMLAFTTGGHIEGLEQFLLNMKERGEIADVHSVRGPQTILASAKGGLLAMIWKWRC